MKVNRQRNPYLKRIFSQTPHKYSYNIESGKYCLLDEKGKQMPINPNGTFHPKFKANYSGFVNHKSRYIDSQNDPSILHFAPDPAPKTNYHNPMPEKFVGYAQYPYKLKDQLPVYLKKPTEKGEYQRRKAQSLILGNHAKSEVSSNKKSANATDRSTILEHSTFKWTKNEDQTFFNTAWTAMSDTKPLPKQKKKTCYNFKCKYMKQWVFDERGKLELQKVDTVSLENTLGRSFHEGALNKEMQESKLLSTMALSGIV